MGWRTQLRGAVIDGLLSERGARLAARVRARGAHRGVSAFLQLDDARSLLMAEVLEGWCQQAGLDLTLVVVPAPDAAFDPSPAQRIANDLRETPWLARSLGLHWQDSWQRPSRGQLSAGHAQLFAAPLSAARFAEVARALWSGEQPSLADVRPEDAGRVALRLEEGRRLLQACGHYQAPLLAVDGDPYFGLLRLSSVSERLRERGVQVSAPAIAKGLRWPDADDIEQLTMFTSFRSPYAYLALERAFALAQRRGLRFRLKPVLPMVMRGLQVPSAKRFYIARDAARQARYRGIPLGKVCDPLGPGIGHCMALFAYAEREEKGLALAISLGRGIWSQARDVTDMADLAFMVERAGISWPLARATLQEEGWRDMAAANRAELLERGLWGVPCFVIGKHALWGQDRLPLIDAWLGAC